MAELSAAQNEIIRIKDQLEKAFYGGAWHGPSVMEVLNDISASKAEAKPINGAHSIWEIVLHIITWHKVVIRRLEGDPALPADEEDWRQMKDFSEESWKRTLVNLKEGFNELISKVGKLDENKLEDTVAGKNYSKYFMLLGLVQHDVYHAGQIALIRKAI